MQRKSFFKALATVLVAPSILSKVKFDKPKANPLFSNFGMLIPQQMFKYDAPKLVNYMDDEPDLFEYLSKSPLNKTNEREYYWAEYDAQDKLSIIAAPPQTVRINTSSIQ